MHQLLHWCLCLIMIFQCCARAVCRLRHRTIPRCTTRLASSQSSSAEVVAHKLAPLTLFYNVGMLDVIIRLDPNQDPEHMHTLYRSDLVCMFITGRIRRAIASYASLPDGEV
jgi:hypothetical protein